MKTHNTAYLPHPSAWRPFKSYAPLFICCGILGLAAGCTSTDSSHLVSGPPPSDPTKAVTTTTTTTAPIGTVAPSGVIVANPAGSSANTITTVVTQTPPALQQEVPLAQPTSGHIWLPGYWTWRNERYEWMQGHWELPPTLGSVWVSPRWDKRGEGYRFYEGYWE